MKEGYRVWGVRRGGSHRDDGNLDQGLHGQLLVVGLASYESQIMNVGVVYV